MPRDARIDTLLLGCTHYPLLADAIRDVVGDGTAVIDSASATASALASLLEVHGLGTPDDARAATTCSRRLRQPTSSKRPAVSSAAAFGTVEAMNLDASAGPVEVTT